MAKKWIPLGASFLLLIAFIGLNFTIEDHVPRVESIHASIDEVAYIYVEIKGAVKNPGVYKLTDHDRIFDALGRAGGLSADADLSMLNQTAFLSDGLLIHVPVLSAESSFLSTGLISLNQSTQATLETLPGIGPATAEAIITYRTHTPFKTTEDLMNVPGIGPQTFEAIHDQVTP